MSDVIVAKIENRRGLRRDLPQPLSPGELGFCLDTLQLFIGADPDDINSVISPVIETFTPDTNSLTYANYVSRNQIVQVILSDVDTPVETGDYGSDIVVTGYEYDVNGTPINGMSFLGYYTPPGSLPVISEGVARWFGDMLFTPTNEFIVVGGSVALALDDSIYTVAYAGAVTEAINYIFETSPGVRPGLVNVRQNVEILTEISSGGSVISGADSDILFPGIQYTLPPSSLWTSVPGFSYQISASDSFVIDYSLYDSTNVTTQYTRTGTLHITTDGVTADLIDNASSIDNIGMQINFRAILSGSTLIIQYITVSAPTLIFTTNTRRWLGF